MPVKRRGIVFLVITGYSAVMQKLNVAAAVMIHKDRVLIAKRKARDENGGYWEFPGGRIRADETPELCLRREIREELGIAISVGRHFITTTAPGPRGSIRLITYLAETAFSTVRPTVHDEVRWVIFAELAAYRFTPADRPVVAALLEQARRRINPAACSPDLPDKGEKGRRRGLPADGESTRRGTRPENQKNGETQGETGSIDSV